MPEQKQAVSKGAASAADPMSSEINDSRFSNFTTDPRFRLPSKKHTRTKIDKRFSRMLNDEDFSNAAKVDRYGRKLSNAGKKKALERLYVPDEEEQEDDEKLQIEVDDDGIIQKELEKAGKTYDPARGGGFSSSEEDEDEDEEDEEDGGVEIEEAAFPDMQAERDAVEMGEISSRIAVVNLDWDNIRSVDLMAVFSSFLPVGGRIHKISIFPSEFGKERMDREELEGPPKEIFTKGQEDEESLHDDSDDSEDTEDEDEADEKIKKNLQKADGGEEFDGAALRKYQLERLRYYYAVIVCSDNDTAQKIYESTDGTEYLSSANYFDLRFIPDGVEFDDKPRDECDSVPSSYRPTEFVTDALQHSKVKLTWDVNPEEAQRKDAIKRAFTGSRAEIGQNDLRAYLGSDSEDDEEEELAAEGDKHDEAPKLSRKELERQKMRAALGLSDEPTTRKKEVGPVGDMEITFAAGLTSNGKEGVFENEPIIEETTAEKYVRKERERKMRKKEGAKARREGRDPDAAAAPAAGAAPKEEAEDLGFDDPFFATDGAAQDKSSKGLRKEERRKKREAKEAEAAAKASQRAELELLIQDNTAEVAERLDHFDINEIARAEKLTNKKGKKIKGKEQGSKRGGLQENFEMDVADERFAGRLFGNHEFAIDPTNPKFKATGGMQKLLEEGRKKRDIGGDVEGTSGQKKKRKIEGGKGELSSLVESVKKKNKR